jgi:hypothetical protein
VRDTSAAVGEDGEFYMHFPTISQYSPLEAVLINANILGIDETTKEIAYRIIKSSPVGFGTPITLLPEKQMRLLGLNEEDVKDDVLIKKAYEFTNNIKAALKMIVKLEYDVNKELNSRIEKHIKKHGLEEIFKDGIVYYTNGRCIDCTKRLLRNQPQEELPQLYELDVVNKDKDFVMRITNEGIEYTVTLFQEPEDEELNTDINLSILKHILEGGTELFFENDDDVSYTFTIEDPNKAISMYISRGKIREIMDREEFAKLVDLYRKIPNEELINEAKRKLESLAEFGVNVDEVNKKVDDYINNQRQEYNELVSKLREEIFGKV